MPIVEQNRGVVLPEFVVDNLGTSFKVILIKSVEQHPGESGMETFIPDYQGLVKKIAITRASHPRKLQGGDIKFLRKSLGLRSKDLAVKLDVSAEHLSRCETGDKILSPNSEKVLRSLVLIEAVHVLRKALEDADCLRSELMDRLNKLLDGIDRVMSGMKIAALHSAEEELVLYFQRVAHDVSRPANDDAPLEWLDQAA